MASAGAPEERPHFVGITSLMAMDPFFQRLFAKIRNRIENPSTPVMCLDSLEHEYLVAIQLFEMYINPSPGEKRLVYTLEARSMRQALQVLSSGVREEAFSFGVLLERMSGSLSDGKFRARKIVLVGADNEDALQAVADAKEYGLLGRVILIGDPSDIVAAAERTKISLSLSTDQDVEILPIDPLAVDFDSKKRSMAEVFGRFLRENRDIVIMTGSLGTAALLHEALSIYRPPPSMGRALPQIAKRWRHIRPFLFCPTAGSLPFQMRLSTPVSGVHGAPWQLLRIR